jgi:hypothetical protein
MRCGFSVFGIHLKSRNYLQGRGHIVPMKNTEALDAENLDIFVNDRKPA